MNNNNMWNEVFYILLFTIVFRISINIVEGALETCRLNEFRCEDGTCLLSEKICNGVEDCSPNGEDETGNDQWDCSRLTLGTSSKCGDHREYFRCRFGGCVLRSQVCDGVVHCFGGSDEAYDICRSGGLRPVPGFDSQGSNRPPNHVRPSTQPPRRPTTSKPQISEIIARPTTPAVIPSRTPQKRPPQISQPLPQKPQVPPQLPPQRPLYPVASRPPPNTQRPQIPVQRPTVPPPIVPIQNHEPQCDINNLDVEEGEEMFCVEKNKKKAINCKLLEGMITNGTTVVYRCKKHYAPPRNGPTATRRLCRNTKWTTKNPKWFCDLQCGMGGRDVIGFIVNGTQSTKGKWPWHVAFYHQDPPGSGIYEYYCGGTLVSPRRVLTAAHCVTKRDSTDKRTDEIILGFGKYYRSFNKYDEHVKFRKISRIDINPYFEAQNYGSDIALVWLNETLELTDRILPACLPLDRQGEVDAGDLGTLAGWGRYSDRGYPEAMQEARLPIVSSHTCQQAHPSLEALVKAQTFCAGYRNSTSACEGDSGGGLVFDYNGRWSVHGVVSSGVAKHTGGCDARFYTVFTRVSRYREWIDQILDARIKR